MGWERERKGDDSYFREGSAPSVTQNFIQLVPGGALPTLVQ